MTATRLLVTLLLFLPPVLAGAQSLKTDDGVKHWECDFSGGLNTDGYQFDLGAAYYPVQFAGVKIRCGISSEIEEFGDWGKDEWETGHHYTTRFRFTSSLVLRTPRLIDWKSQDAGFYLFAEPGILLTPGASGSHNARWVCWEIKGGVNLQMDRFILYLGYGISNFSLYSGFPTNHWGEPEKDNYTTHSVFIGAAYKF